MSTALNRIPRDGQLVRLPIQLGMSTYNILVSVRRILVVNEYSLRKNWGKLVQKNCKLEVQKDECRLCKSIMTSFHYFVRMIIYVHSPYLSL
jgi:hypothetical protein